MLMQEKYSCTAEYRQNLNISMNLKILMLQLLHTFSFRHSSFLFKEVNSLDLDKYSCHRAAYCTAWSPTR